MAVTGDLSAYAAFRSSPNILLHTSLPPPLKVNFSNFVRRESLTRGITTRCHSNKPLDIKDFEMLHTTIDNDDNSFLFNAINMSFLKRVTLAWKILFPSPSTIQNSNANIAKQRLKMILFSDRCAVSDDAKQKIVSNVVNALSDFVVIEPQDKVQLSVSTDPALGTVYSVTVPVRRVRAEYQEEDEATIVDVEYKDNGAVSGSVDVKFDFYVPTE
ncbi:putative Cell division topological specificity factor MinE [Helianthus anomalus]